MFGYRAQNNKTTQLHKVDTHSPSDHSLEGISNGQWKKVQFRKKMIMRQRNIDQRISNRNRSPVRQEITDHPLYIQLSEMIQKESTLNGRLLGDRRSLLKLKRSLTQLQFTLSTTRNARSTQHEKLAQLEKRIENMRVTRIATDIKSELEFKSKILNDLQKDYHAASTELRLNGGGASSGVRAKLMRSLENKRLSDEEALYGKYSRIKMKLDVVIENLKSQRVCLLSGNTVSSTTEANDEDLSIMLVVQDKQREIAELKNEINILIDDEDKLQSEEKRMKKVLQEASDKFASANSASDYSNNIKEVTRLKETFLSKINNSHVVSSRITAMHESIKSIECDIREAENAIKTLQHRIDERQSFLDSIKNKIDKNANSRQRDAEDAILALEREKANIKADIKREKESLEKAKMEEQLITVKLMSAKKYEDERNIAHLGLTSSMLKKKEEVSTAKESLKELKEKHGKELEDVMFLTQKDAILSDLSNAELKWSSKLREINKSNTELEGQLRSAVHLLKENNIELPF